MSWMRLWCQTCHKEVGAGHRTPEPHWFHRTELATFNEGELIMPKSSRKVVKTSKVPPKSAKVAPKASTKPATKESSAALKARLLAEEKSAKRSRK
jgi:hypothetical protein